MDRGNSRRADLLFGDKPLEVRVLHGITRKDSFAVHTDREISLVNVDVGLLAPAVGVVVIDAAPRIRPILRFPGLGARASEGGQKPIEVIRHDLAGGFIHARSFGDQL